MTLNQFSYPFLRTFPAKGHKGLSSPQHSNILVRSLESCILTANHRETIRRILSKPTRKKGAQLNIRFLPNHTISKKPLGTRMGTGKGRPEKKVACLRKGAPIFVIHGNITGIPFKKLFKRIKFRFPIDLKVKERLYIKSLPTKIQIRIKKNDIYDV
jgi:large subunit ribosomal protein L16